MSRGEIVFDYRPECFSEYDERNEFTVNVLVDGVPRFTKLDHLAGSILQEEVFYPLINGKARKDLPRIIQLLHTHAGPCVKSHVVVLGEDEEEDPWVFEYGGAELLYQHSVSIYHSHPAWVR